MHPFYYKTSNFTLAKDPRVQDNLDNPAWINLVYTYKYPGQVLVTHVCYTLDRFTGRIVDIDLSSFDDFDSTTHTRVCPPILSSETVETDYWNWYRLHRESNRNTPIDIRIKVERHNMLKRLNVESYGEALNCSMDRIENIDPDLALVLSCCQSVSCELPNCDAATITPDDIDGIHLSVSNILVNMERYWNATHIKYDHIHIVPSDVLLQTNTSNEANVIIRFKVSGFGTDLFCARIAGYTNSHDLCRGDKMSFVLSPVTEL